MTDFSPQETEILRNSTLLNHWSEESYNDFMAISTRATFEKGDFLLREGETSDDFFIIISGVVALYKEEEDHSEPQLIAELKSGETIGEMRVIQNRTCSLTVKVKEPLVVLRTSINQLHSVEHRKCHDSLVSSILKILNDRLYHSNNIILDKIHQKKRKHKQLIFAVCGIVVMILFLGELSLALYYAMNPSDFCNNLNSFPGNNKVSS